MGIFGKLLGKKEPLEKELGLDLGPMPGEEKSDLGLGSDTGLDLGAMHGEHGDSGMPPGGLPPMGSAAGHQAPKLEPELVRPSQTPITAPAQPPLAAPSGDISKDLQIISAKLDALKASMDSLNMRVHHIEELAKASEEAATHRVY